MFPIRDHNPSEKTPYVTYAIIAVNLVVFLSYWPLLADDAGLSGLFNQWAMIPQKIVDGNGQITLLTSMFLHAGLWHLAGNMLFLWIFGDNLEDQLGHFGFLLFYLICGIGAGLVHLASDPTSAIPTVGASGAIAGVMGGYLLLFPRARVDVVLILIIFFKVFTVPAWIMLGFWFGLQLFSSVTTNAAADGVAYWAHAGGFVIGFVYLLPLWLKRGGRSFWNFNHGLPPHPKAQYELGKSRIPRVRKKNK